METQYDGSALSVFAVDRRATAETIWNTLSQINVNDKIEKKNGFSYLSWAWAWGTLMEHFPNSRFSFVTFDNESETFYFPDGTAEVRCELTVDGISRIMWLPVMDHRNKAILKPDARAINDTKMRCLVKAMALFGLGHYIYAGEDLPDASKAPEPAADQKDPAADPVDDLRKALNGAATLDELKAAFTKASKYAKNRSDAEMLASFAAIKDAKKVALS